VSSAQALAASRAAASGDSAVSAPADDVQLHLSEAGADGVQHNAHAVLCRFCDTKILLAGAGDFTDKELQLHLLGGSKTDPTRDTLHAHWLVHSQMAFENVGVTRGVDPAYRYLTCANWSVGRRTYNGRQQLNHDSRGRV